MPRTSEVDPRPDLPRIDLGEPLAGQWVKIDRDELRMRDFVTIETCMELSASEDGEGMVRAMPKLLSMMSRVVIATSLPGATIEDALADLRPPEFMAVVSAFGASSSVPNAS